MRERRRLETHVQVNSRDKSIKLRDPLYFDLGKGNTGIQRVAIHKVKMNDKEY